ncbi:Protein FAM107B [Chionoecetes opilio]|uniref:Protein FAM107B n=1 Tax=Chionoecetes opilio TaxID=41210 RepID=A0A8J4Y385_CHIOP|nr:Protein FAM107B [Chionoecetes opilio]
MNLGVSEDLGVVVIIVVSFTEVVYGAMIPEPDYSDDERETSGTKQAALALITRNNQVNASSPTKKEEAAANPERMDDKGLIMPKRLVNPNMESTEKKSLHKELLYNQKRGMNVLNQKTELQKAMEKHNDKKVLKEIKKEKEAALTPFQKALDERAQKIEQQMEKVESKDDDENEKKGTCEFQKIHAKVRAKMEVQ